MVAKSSQWRTKSKGASIATLALIVTIFPAPPSSASVIHNSRPNAISTDFGATQDWGVVNCGIVNCTWYLNRRLTHKLHAAVDKERMNIERYGNWYADGAGVGCSVMGALLAGTVGAAAGPSGAAVGAVTGGIAAERFCVSLTKNSLGSFTKHLSDADRANQCFAVRMGATPQFLVRSNSFCRD